MDDFMTLCLLGVFLIVGFMLFSRMMRGFGNGGYGQQGDEYPRYDDPNVSSRGRFGGGLGRFRPGANRPTYDSPDVRSCGFFGRSRPTFSGRSSSSGRTDSPNIRSRGGFGRSKD